MKKLNLLMMKFLIRNKKLRLDTKWFIGEAFNTFVSTFFSSSFLFLIKNSVYCIV